MVNLCLYTAITASIATIAVGLPTNSAPFRRSTSTSSGILPFQSPSFLPPAKYHGFKPLSPVPTGPITRGTTPLNIKDFPEPWEDLDTNHPEVQRAIKSIDWNKVPNHEVRYDGMEYDAENDPTCYWSLSQCTEPKIDYIYADVYYCPNEGDFGLTYDDGPLNSGDEWAEPRLYDFLAARKQTATLFYVGSNVVNFPEAAVRALQSGHTLSAHTYTHKRMTYISNEMIVAELYWTIRAIKEATGVTVTSWRPPFGDVDDRVRAIAHQMGLRTIIWDKDSVDWGLPSPANENIGKETQETVDSYFQDWIDERVNGVDFISGHIVLEHETSFATIQVAEKWLPKLQAAFNVKTVHDCAPELQSPYWEA